MPPRNPSLRLASDIEQCEAALADKTNTLKSGCTALRKDLRSLRKEVATHKDCKDPAKLNKLVEKRDLLRLKVDALEKEHEAFRSQQQKQIDLLNKAVHEKYERMHGLLAYGVATGGLSSDATLLFNTLGDFLNASSDSDRKAAGRAVSLILEHGNLEGAKAGTDSADDEILRRFEAIRDDGERTSFYQKFKGEILAGYEARKQRNS